MVEEERKGWRAAADAKWTNAVGRDGYSVIPNNLFWFAADLGLKPARQAVLFQLLSYWWKGESSRAISKATLAWSLGITERQVQRHLSALRKSGLIEARFPNKPGRHPYEYTFKGLVAKLKEFAIATELQKRYQVRDREDAVRATSRR